MSKEVAPSGISHEPQRAFDHLIRPAAILVALVATAFACYFVFVSRRSMPDLTAFLALCAAFTCYGLARTILPTTLRPRFLEPVDPAKRVSHAFAVAAFYLVCGVISGGCTSLLLLRLIEIGRTHPFVEMNPIYGPSPPCIALAMAWVVYARAIRCSTAQSEQFEALERTDEAAPSRDAVDNGQSER